MDIERSEKLLPLGFTAVLGASRIPGAGHGVFLKARTCMPSIISFPCMKMLYCSSGQMRGGIGCPVSPRCVSL